MVGGFGNWNLTTAPGAFSVCLGFFGAVKVDEEDLILQAQPYGGQR